jgi:hypothetical protein
MRNQVDSINYLHYLMTWSTASTRSLNLNRLIAFGRISLEQFKLCLTNVGVTSYDCGPTRLRIIFSLSKNLVEIDGCFVGL